VGEILMKICSNIGVRPDKLIIPLPLAIAFFDETKRPENLARNRKEEGRHLVLLFRPTSHATAKPWPNQSSTPSRQAQIMHFFDNIAITILNFKIYIIASFLFCV
jgi:hypothetical protein